MGIVDKWPSRMQGQWFFRNRAGGQQFSIGSRESGFNQAPCGLESRLESVLEDEVAETW